MNSPETTASTETAGSDWYDQARVIDNEWVEIVLNTGAEEVRYRVPRRTHFDAVDRVVEMVAGT